MVSNTQKKKPSVEHLTKYIVDGSGNRVLTSGGILSVTVEFQSPGKSPIVHTSYREVVSRSDLTYEILAQLVEGAIASWAAIFMRTPSTLKENTDTESSKNSKGKSIKSSATSLTRK